ncbi:MAG: MarR family transcriptional regulator [Acidimicrobiia bacterium]|nr:MarR family transcriptional regulator [Acidimicrobiia bacterium]
MRSTTGGLSQPHRLTEQQRLFSGIAKTVFLLNGQALAIAEDLAGPVGLTAAWWQVLATVLREPLSVADISRRVGTSRQSVQRVADRLVGDGLAEYQPNPAHRRAKLLTPTDDGRSAVRAIAPAHAELAHQLAIQFGEEKLSRLLDNLQELSAALDKLPPLDRPRSDPN